MESSVDADFCEHRTRSYMPLKKRKVCPSYAEKIAAMTGKKRDMQRRNMRLKAGDPEAIAERIRAGKMVRRRGDSRAAAVMGSVSKGEA
jgi:hypothetical protein